jgi:hypothetical protein
MIEQEESLAYSPKMPFVSTTVRVRRANEEAEQAWFGNQFALDHLVSEKISRSPSRPMIFLDDEYP